MKGASSCSIRVRAVFLAACAASLAAAGCAAPRPHPYAEKAGEHGGIVDLATDLARYAPGQPVRFRLRLDAGARGDALFVRYSHLARTVKEEEVKLTDGAASWSWKPPQTDDQGYYVDVFLRQGGTYTDHAGIGVDVSSDWSKFPRYGYLADFREMPESAQRQVIDRLNRLHVNGIQFYDWQSKHHMPLAEDKGSAAAAWTDIANRPVSGLTLRRYIDEAHARGMKAMNYNLLFGANEGYEQDGAKREWGLFTDTQHEVQDRHPLPSSWKSDIELMDPNNPDWQRYWIEQERKAADAFPFDGYHVDQLGDRGAVFDYNGRMADLPSGYLRFLEEASSRLDGDFVMNAVNGFGQEQIAQAPVKFLYTELWMNEYQDLKRAIDLNGKWSGGRLNTVLAAYMDYDLADGPGRFNEPGVLLTDAVIFASGGAHIEAGEGLLAKEYFPNRNLEVPESLWRRLEQYYDFLVAYENLLRDGQEEADAPLASVGGPALSDIPKAGKLWKIGKRKGKTDIVHLINLSSADSTEWRDAEGTQPEPALLTDLHYEWPLKDGQRVSRIWTASPDRYGGSPEEIPYREEGGSVAFALPSLRYWDMVVIEYR
jgi:dextranase